MCIKFRLRLNYLATVILLLLNSVLVGCSESPSIIESLTEAVSETKQYGIFKTNGVSAHILGLIPFPDTGFVFSGHKKAGNMPMAIGMSPGKTYRLVGEFGCDNDQLKKTCKSCEINETTGTPCSKAPVKSSEVRNDLLELQRLGKLIVLKKFETILKSAQNRVTDANEVINRPVNAVINVKDPVSSKEMTEIKNIIQEVDANATNNYNEIKTYFTGQQKNINTITSKINDMSLNLCTLKSEINASVKLKQQVAILESLKQVTNTITDLKKFIESKESILVEITSDQQNEINPIITKLKSEFEKLVKNNEKVSTEITQKFSKFKETFDLLKQNNSSETINKPKSQSLATEMKRLVTEILEIVEIKRNEQTAKAIVEFKNANPSPANPLLEPRNWSLSDNSDDLRTPNIWKMEWYSPSSQLSDEKKIRQLEALFEFKLHKAVKNLRESNVMVFTWVQKSKSENNFTLLPFASGSRSKTRGNYGYILLDGLRISQLFIGKDFQHNVLKTGATGDFFDSSFMGTTIIQTHGAYLYSELEMETEIGAALKITAKDVAHIVKGDPSILMELNLAVQSYYASMGVFGNFGNVKQIKWKKMAPNYFNATNQSCGYDQFDGALGNSHLNGIPYLYDTDSGEFSNTLNTQWHTVYTHGMRIRHLLGVRKDWWSENECICADATAMKKGLQVQLEANKAITLASSQVLETSNRSKVDTPTHCSTCDK